MAALLTSTETGPKAFSAAIVSAIPRVLLGLIVGFVIERASHPDGRIKAMRLTSKGRRALEVARPLWAQAPGKVLRELGTKAVYESVWSKSGATPLSLIHAYRR